MQNLIKKIKEKNTEIATKFSNFLLKYKFISPNLISISGFIIAGIIGSIFILLKFYTLSAIIILFGFWLDSVDGNFARNNNLSSKKGAVIDSVLDRYTDLIILSSIILVNRDWLVLGLLSIIGSCIIPYIRARVEAVGIKPAQTFATREIRCAIIIVGLLFHLIFYMLLSLAILTNLSAIHRLYFSLKNIEKNEINS